MLGKNRWFLFLLLGQLALIGCSNEQSTSSPAAKTKTFSVGDPLAPGYSNSGTTYTPPSQRPLIDRNGFIRGPIIDEGFLPVIDTPVFPEPAAIAPAEAIQLAP